MDRLVASLLRFQNEVFPRDRHRYEKLANGQSPDTLFIGCSDSRILPNDMLQAGAGELFICRNAGNIVPPHGEDVYKRQAQDSPSTSVPAFA